MMHVLMESGSRPRPRKTQATVTSLAVHAGIITLSVVLTSRGPLHGTATEGADRPPVIYVAPAPAPPRTTPVTTTAGGPTVAMPTPLDIQIPASLALPRVPSFDASAPFSENVLSVLARGDGLTSELSSAVAMNGMVHTSAAVDRVAVALAVNPRPAYPQSLRSAGLEGDVRITFVVDTTGRVEPGSLNIVQSTHPLFSDAVRRWLPFTRYRPAEIGGRRVRQYVQQEVGFALATER